MSDGRTGFRYTYEDFELDELAVQNVVAAAHDPEGRPVANRQQNEYQNTDFEHGRT